jgi:murein peptide amidase A
MKTAENEILTSMRIVQRLIAMTCLLPMIGLAARLDAAESASLNPGQRQQPAGGLYVVGRSVEGRPIHCQEFGSGDDVVMIIATIHGDEAAGTPLVARLADWLLAHPEELAGRKVVIIPVANPDGMAAGQRLNLRQVDLNRNYPAGNWGNQDSKPPGAMPLSEPESRTLMKLVCHYFPNRVVAIHQPLHCIDYDGPAKKLAEAMAAACPLAVKKLGSRPGSLGSLVGVTLKRPIITLELPEDAGMDGDKLWQTYGNALIAALRYSDQ